MKDIGSIVFYGAPWCGDCIRSENVLNRMDIEYKKIDIDENPEVEGYIRKIQKGSRKIPLIVFEDKSFLIEPSDEDLISKLEELISN